MRATLLVAVCACNQVFDLDRTRLPTNESECPPIGETPQFRPGLLQYAPRDCDGYNFRGTSAVASCFYPGGFVVEAGTVDGELGAASGIPADTVFRELASISPDETRLYVQERVGSAVTIALYRRQPDRSWLLDPAIRLQVTTNSPDRYRSFGTIATDGERDRAVVVTAENLGIIEYTIDQTWTPVRTTEPSKLGVAEIRGFSMTSDGLRATFQGARDGAFRQLYTDRAHVDEEFRVGDVLDNVPFYRHAFLPDDCGRIYMSGAGSIFYARR